MIIKILMHGLPCSFPFLASWNGAKPQGDLGSYSVEDDRASGSWVPEWVREGRSPSNQDDSCQAAADVRNEGLLWLASDMWGLFIMATSFLGNLHYLDQYDQLTGGSEGKLSLLPKKGGCPLHWEGLTGQLPSRTGTPGDSPGGPAVKNLPCNAGDVGLIPDRGTDSPRCGTTEPTCCRARRPWLERGLWAATETSWAAAKTWHSQKRVWIPVPDCRVEGQIYHLWGI